MRPFRWLLVPIAIALLAVASPAVAARPVKNNVQIVEPERIPDNLLSEEEVAKIDRLQNDAVFTLATSPVSPDDQAVFVTRGESIGFLSLEDGGFTAVDPNSFGPVIPLPLLGATQFSWVDDRTLGALGLNFFASTLEELYVVVLIDRLTGEVSGSLVPLPANTDIVAVGPDFTRYLLVQIPEEFLAESGEGGIAGALRSTSVQLTLPETKFRPEGRPNLPTAFQARIDRMAAQKPHLMQKIEWLRQEADDEDVDLTTIPLDLLRYDAATGDVGYVTTIPQSSFLLGEAWTNNADTLAMSFISLSESDDPRPVFDGALISETIYQDVTGNLAPANNPYLQGNNTYIVDFVGGDTRILRTSGAAAPPLLVAADWSPDGQTLMTQAWYPARLRGRTHPVYTTQFSERVAYRFYNRALEQVGEFGPNIFASGAFSSAIGTFVSNDEVIFRGISGTDRHPYYYNRVSGEFRNLATRAGSYFNLFPTNNSRRLVFTHTSFTTPPDVYTIGMNGAGLQRLTWTNEELRQEAALAEYPVSFTLRNGQTRVGTLIQPAGAEYPPRNRQIIVWQEGGPGVSMNGLWLANVENPYALLPSFGYSLLVMPLSGRPGYTPATFNALADGGNFGSIDIDEQAEVVRQMITRGWTSAGKIGITGCSYGGYFTWQSVVRHPDLYAAANPQCALVDLVTEWSRGYSSLIPNLQGPPPYVIPNEYRADSPFYNADRVRTPVLSFHGSDDFLPVVQNENLHLQLFNRGVNVRMVKFIGAGHGLGSADYQLYAAQEQINWFRTYLK